ncbi:AraC family transcriptional regulator [Nocardia neocaledoniensis]|uniref:AraC family transcriptional regulator n=1 Tax=Nocardia neocaledoniensis TaxID=236511 RepID=A0A317N964_9NOCA|nr:AraC family transcriptional regulator [Nocardia neocaledoniensis]PWV70128.1 AraC family transcriptional regulator [Nocardia neocaledoniensis]GEM34144.1 transcriptional regulator [Nocardia neocaledoniensis NBRC 108232]
MVHWDIPRAPVGALLTTRLAEERGVPVATCLRGSGLTADLLADPEAEVSASAELAVIANVLRALGDPPGLGLRAGSLFRVTSYGMWGFALISSPTVRSAIQAGLQFIDLTFAFSAVEMRRTDGDLQLALTAPDVPEPLRRFVLERDMAAVQTLNRDLLATPIPITTMRSAFSGAAPLYTETFGRAPEFDADECVIGFDQTHLDVPLPQANAHTAAITLAHCRALLDRRTARGGTASRVRDILVEHLAQPPNAPRLAAMLHLSERTLRHHLAKEGTSYRALLDEVRERLAEELLVTRGLPVAEIAHRLGYVEVSSFSQAFRRWKGMGPRAYRDRRALG